MLKERIYNLPNIIPDYVKSVGKALLDNNFQAYIVGGCVRDSLLGRTPKDWDIATNATPDQISTIFDKAIMIGAQFGTVAVLAPDQLGENHQVEVTTFRAEANYIGGRWPSEVSFSQTIEQDLMRRDFTINALAFDLNTITNSRNSSFSTRNAIIDLHGGLQDLQAKIVRCVGNPIERFTEDGLRPYRACRFASTLEFEIDPNTFDAIRQTLNVAKMVSTERIRDEFTRLLLESPKPSVGIDLLRQSGLLELFLPELLEGYGVEQNDYHVEDVYWHNLHCADIAHDDVKIAALFHDIAKPRTKQGSHFYGHDLKGAEMVEEIMKRMRFSNDEIETTANLVRWHMFYYPLSNAQSDEERLMERKKMMQQGWSDQAVRRFLRRVGGQENTDLLFKLRIADATCNPKSTWDPTEIEALEARISKVLQQDLALKVTDLDITGHDLMELGIPQGPKIKETLEYLLEKVEENPNLNSKEKLMEMARNYFSVS